MVSNADVEARNLHASVVEEVKARAASIDTMTNMPRPDPRVDCGWWRGNLGTLSRDFAVNCSGKHVPVGNAKRLCNQFKTLTVGDLLVLVRQETSDRVCHSFGIAIVAHDLSSFA